MLSRVSVTGEALRRDRRVVGIHNVTVGSAISCGINGGAILACDQFQIIILERFRAARVNLDIMARQPAVGCPKDGIISKDTGCWGQAPRWPAWRSEGHM